MEKLKENQEIDIENLKFENDENLEKELLEKYDIKLDSDESVFYKFTCHSKFWLCFEILCYFIVIFGACGVILIGTIFYKIGCLILLLFLLLSVLPCEIRNFIHLGIYITDKKLITCDGKVFLLKNIYFKDCGHKRGHYGIDLYDNEKFILCCYNENKNNFNILILLSYHLSCNDIILQFKTNENKILIKKTKLINN